MKFFVGLGYLERDCDGDTNSKFVIFIGGVPASRSRLVGIRTDKKTFFGC